MTSVDKKRKNSIGNSNESLREINPLKSTLAIPNNKSSAWVYQRPQERDDDPGNPIYQRPLPKEPAAVWSTGTYVLEKIMTRQQRKEPMELWTFFDDDPLGIEESILRNNPQQGLWGYDATVKCRPQSVRPVKTPLPLGRPEQIVIVPPDGEIPKGLQVAGTWIRPQYKRDVSALADGTVGFLQVSASLERYEKHSIGGAWKMLACNDVMQQGQKKNKKNDKEAPNDEKTSRSVPKPQKSFDVKDVLTEEKTSGSVPKPHKSFNDKAPKDKAPKDSDGPVTTIKPNDLDPNRIHVKDPKDKNCRRTISFPFDPTKSWDVPSVLEPIAKKLNRNPRKIQLFQDDDGLPVTPDRPPIPGTVYSVKDLEPEQVHVSVPSKNRSFVLLVDPNTEGLPGIEERAKKQAGILPIQPFHLIPDISDQDKPSPGKRCFVLVPDNPTQPTVPDEDREALTTAPIAEFESDDSDNDPSIPKNRDFVFVPERSAEREDPKDKNKVKIKPQKTQLPPVEIPSIKIQTPDKSRIFLLYIDPEPPSPRTISKRPKYSLSMLPTHTPNDVNDVIGQRNSRVFFTDIDGNQLRDDDPLGRADLHPDKILRMEITPSAIIETPRKSRTFALYIDPEPPSPRTRAKRPKYSLSMLPTNTPNDVNEEIGDPKNRVFFMDAEGNQLGDDTPLSHADLSLDRILRMERLPDAMIETPSRSRTFALYIDPEPPSPRTRAKRPKHSLSMLPTNTPNDVNEAINDVMDQGKNRVFFWDDEGRQLEHDEPLENASLSLDRILRMEPINEDVFTFRAKGGRTFAIYISPDDTIKNVKRKLREKSNLEFGGFRLGDLDFDDVDEDALFRDHVRPGFILDAEPPRVEIRVPGTNEKIRMAILPTTTMRDVEKVVEEKLNMGQKKGPRVFLFDRDECLDSKTPIIKKLDFEKGWQLEVRDFQVQVEHWDGQRVTLNVMTTEYIDDVKEKIAESALLVPADRQILTLNGKPTDVSLTLEAQNITQGCILKLEQMKIYLALPSGDKIAFLVKQSTTILRIKTKACKKTNIPLEVLRLMSGSTEYADAKTLGEYNVAHKDTIQIELFRVDIMDIHGEKATMVNLRPTDTIKTLKKKIERKTSVPKGKQLLKLESRVVEDDGTLESEGIPHRALLTMVDLREVDLSLPASEQQRLGTSKIKKFKSAPEEIWPVVPDWKKRIFFFDIDDSLDCSQVDVTAMHWTGKDLVIPKVRLAWSLTELKQHMFRLHGIGAKNETVLFNGKKLDFDRTLRQQGLQHKSIIVVDGKRENNLDLPAAEKLDFWAGLGALPTFLSGSISIKIRHWLGYEFVVGALPTHYLDDVKELIFDQRKIPVDQQRITYKGFPVDETESLGDQGIANGCVFQLEPMKISVSQPSTGGQAVLVVESDDTIRDVKKQIFKRMSVPTELQCIMFGGEELSNSKTLQECSVDHEDVLQLEEFTVSIMHWLGDVFRLKGIRPESTIGEVKQEILRFRYVPKKQQSLLYKGKTLQDNKTLADELVSHKSVLILEEKIEAPTSEQPRRLFNFMAGLDATATSAQEDIDG